MRVAARRLWKAFWARFGGVVTVGLGIAGTAALSYPDFQDKSWWWFVLALLIFVPSLVIANSRDAEKAVLQQLNAELQQKLAASELRAQDQEMRAPDLAREVLHLQVWGLFESIDMAHLDAAKCRVTLYRPMDRGFLRVARYSGSEKFRCSKGRAIYPLHKGLLGKTWNERRTNVVLHADPAQQLEEYIRLQCSIGLLDEETARELSMQSTVYVGIRIDDQGKLPLGILMFESTQVGILPDVDRMLTPKAMHELAMLMERALQVLPTGDTAKKAEV